MTPYGYRIENGRAYIVEDYAEKIRTFFARYLDGLSMESAGGDIPLSAAGLGKLLSNRVYLGTDFYPQLIDQETFDRANAERAKRYAAMGQFKTGTRRNASAPEDSFVLDLKEDEIPAGDPAALAVFLYSSIRPDADGRKRLSGRRKNEVLRAVRAATGKTRKKRR